MIDNFFPLFLDIKDKLSYQYFIFYIPLKLENTFYFDFNILSFITIINPFFLITSYIEMSKKT
jgi:uncharacterized protein YueI